jgi:hypothetical protein
VESGDDELNGEGLRDCSGRCEDDAAALDIRLYAAVRP